MADTTPDYSNSPLAPTQVTWTADGTGFRTTLSNAVGGTDPKDYVTFTVPAGQRLTSFELSSYSSSDGVAFIALQPGSTVTGSSSNTTPFSGYSHFGSSSSIKVGTNLIAVLGGPLQAGSYSAWIQQLGASTDYSFTVKTTALPDTTPPTIAITSSKTKVKAGETALITFTLSEPATDFIVSDIVVTGSGTLTGFSGSGSNYSAVFTPPTTGEGSSVVSVGNFKFSDAAGNANQDGADANNRLELTYDTVGPTIIINSNKTYLGLGENAAITFTLSEPSTDFTIENITTTYGTLTGFSGSGKSYTATFVPSGVDVGLITVNGSRFSDSFGNQNDQSNRLLITPFDPSRGNVQWTRLLGSSSNDSAYALTTGTDGAIYMAGYTEGSLDGQTSSGLDDAFLTKYDVNGNKAWTRLLGTSEIDSAYALTTGTDGAIYMAGETYGSLDGQTSSGYGDAFLTKYNTDGTKAWTKVLGGEYQVVAFALTTGTDGAIYMAGSAQESLDGQTSSGGWDVFLTKYDVNGNKAWTRLLGTDSYDYAPSLTTGTDGAIYMAGSAQESLDGQTSSGSTDAFLTKYDANGNKAWTKQLGTTSDDYARALTTGTDGAIYMAGETDGSLDGQTNSGSYDAFITKYDVNGNKAWTRLLGSNSFDRAWALTTGTDGAIYMAGYTFGSLDGQTSSGYGDAFLTKYDVNGNKAWTRLLGTRSDAEAKALTTGTDGAIYMAGYTGASLDGQTNSGGSDAFLAKFVLPDSAIPTIALQADKTSVAAGGSVAITFTLSKPSTNFIASDVTVVNGVLSNFSGSGATYTATFTPSLGSATASLSVGSGKFSDALGNFNEDGAETNNTVTISISGSTRPTIQFSTTSSSASEGNTGSTTVTVQATLSAASTQAVTVPITYSGTATSGTDYSSPTTSITIAAGQTTGSASFSVICDTTVEPNETVILTMGTPTNATLGANTSYTHTITNDDLNAGPKGLGGVAYHWKSHALLSGVTVSTRDQKAVQADSDLFDLRAANFDAANGTLTVQLWVNPVKASMNFDVSAVTQGATSASFSSSLTESTWTLSANTENPNDVSISGLLNELSAAGVTGALQLGTLTMVLTPNAPVAVSFKNLSVGDSTSADVSLTLASASTDASGAFGLSLPDGSYGLTVSRAVGDGSNNNGVSSADALAALKIAVGMNPNTDPDGSGPLKAPMLSPYQVMAADANGDGRVSSADALAILKMSVKRADAPSPSWMFVEEDRDFWDEAAKAFTLSKSNAAWDAQIAVALPADAKTNLVGVLKGDVNGSWTLAGASTVESSNPNYFKDLAQLISVPVDQWGIFPGG